MCSCALTDPRRRELSVVCYELTDSKATGEKDPIKVMQQLREMKNAM